MRFIRNWVIPILACGVFAALGMMMLGLPGVAIVQTLDGNPVPGGIRPEQVKTIISEGRKLGSYLDFYGVRLPGQPLYWSIGFPLLMGFLGYRVGSLSKARPQP